MGTFTIPLCDLIEQGVDIGLMDYPIWDEEYREVLNTKIIRHYWTYEIGQETVDQFRLVFNRTMHENMPYFNQLYKSTLIEFDPLSTVNVDSTTDSDSTNTVSTSATSNTTSTTDGSSRVVVSETPQVRLSGDEDYASGATDSHSLSGAQGTAQTTGTDSTTGAGKVSSKVTGYQGPASDLLMKYRDTFLNIDMEVINSLADCFMLLWDNGDQYTEGTWNDYYWPGQFYTTTVL